MWNYESYGSSSLIFLRNLHPVFHSDCSNLHSHQQCTWFPFLHILANTCYLFVDNRYSEMCEVIYPIVICILLMINDVEHLLMCLLAILYLLWTNVYSDLLFIF